MDKLMIPGILLLTLMVFGCQQSEEPQSAPEQPATAEETTAAEEPATEQESEAGEAPSGEQQEETLLEETAEKISDTTAAAGEKAGEMLTEAKEATGQAVDEMVEATTSETIVFEASYGDVTFPHTVHADTYDCATCHGEGTPGSLDLDKDKAHALCRDCHKEEGAGPTGCRDCHKK